MQPTQEILLPPAHKRLLPLFADILQHLRRIIVTVPTPGLHKIILGRQEPRFLPDFLLHCLQVRLPRINLPLGKLPRPFLPGTFATSSFPSSWTINPATLERYNLSMSF